LWFYLKGRLVLSKNADEAIPGLEEMFSEVNDGLLAKGASEGEGAKLLSWLVLEDTIELEIESPGIVRPHDALLRLKNQIGKQLGRKYRLGVRQSFIDEYTIEFSVPHTPEETIEIPFAESAEIKDGRCRLIIHNVTEEMIKTNYIDRMINLTKEKIDAQDYQGKGEHWEQIWRSPERELVYSADPTEEMVKKGWIKQGPTKGKWFFRSEITKIMRTMERIAIEEVLEPMGFQEIVASHMVPFDIWIRTGHMQGSPNEFYYVSEPKTRDADIWERFMDRVKITREVDRDSLAELVTTPKAGLCYAQCPVIYWSLRGETVSEESLPIKIYDRTANSCRYESGGRHGMERVDEFHRLEPVYIGTEEQLIEIKNLMMERYKHVFNNILELEWRMAWVTPFYMQQSGAFGVEDDEEKVKGTVDFESYMPYRGNREESEWLEFQNFSIVGDKYTSAFNIKAQKSKLWSGCSGIGLERWTAAFLAQWGLDPEKWPEGFRKRFGEMPKGIEIL